MRPQQGCGVELREEWGAGGGGLLPGISVEVSVDVCAWDMGMCAGACVFCLGLCVCACGGEFQGWCGFGLVGLGEVELGSVGSGAGLPIGRLTLWSASRAVCSS